MRKDIGDPMSFPKNPILSNAGNAASEGAYFLELRMRRAMKMMITTTATPAMI